MKCVCRTGIKLIPVSCIKHHQTFPLKFSATLGTISFYIHKTVYELITEIVRTNLNGRNANSEVENLIVLG